MESDARDMHHLLALHGLRDGLVEDDKGGPQEGEEVEEVASGDNGLDEQGGPSVVERMVETQLGTEDAP